MENDHWGENILLKTFGICVRRSTGFIWLSLLNMVVQLSSGVVRFPSRGLYSKNTRQAPGSTQSPVQWRQGFFSQRSSSRSVKITIHLRLITRLRISGAVLYRPICLRSVQRIKFAFGFTVTFTFTCNFMYFHIRRVVLNAEFSQTSIAALRYQLNVKQFAPNNELHSTNSEFSTQLRRRINE
jgi:hypothetical protein